MIYRPLVAGEIIEDGDEVDSAVGMNDDPRWVKASCIGEHAPDPSYPAHRRYRRPSIKWSCKDHHEHSTEWEAEQCILLHDAVQLLKETDGVDPWLPEEFLYWHGTRLEITRKWDAAEQRRAADVASSANVEVESH